MPSGRVAFFEVARSEGARYLFTNPGTTELPIFDEMAEETGIGLIMCLHEGVAMGAADGYAQATGRPSLVNLHIAPGLANGLSGMFNAWWSRSPVVVTAGQQDTRHLIQDPMLAGDLVSIARPYSKWTYECRRADEVGVAMRRAFQFAAAPPSGPTFVSIPWDTMDEQADFAIPGPSQIDHASAASASAIETAVRMLLDAERPLLVAGDAIARAGAVAEAVRVAELLGCRVASEPIAGRVDFPADHPLYAGGMAPLNSGIRSALEQGDVAFLAGVQAFAPLYPSSIPAVPPGVTLIQLSEDPYELAKTYPVAVGMTGGIKASLRSLADAIERLRTPAQAKRASERISDAAQGKQAAREAIAQAVEAQRNAKPIKPLVAAAEIGEALEPGTILVDESVTSTLAVRAMIPSSEPDTYFFTRGGGLGFGLPAALGVKLAKPDRPVVALVGDGATLYTPQALWTAAHHDIPIVGVILNNSSYLILKTGLANMQGKAAKNDVWPAMDIIDPPVDFGALARTFGVAFERVTDAADVGPAVRKAVGSGAPALVEVVVDGALNR
jgi:benzoylformate decarboxylase